MSGKKLVVIIKDGLETGKAMNALAHAMLGFGAGVISKEDARLNKYEDKNGNIHNNISERGIIILKATAGKIKAIKNQAKEEGLQFVDFTDTMSIGTYQEEYDLTKTRSDEELNYWALVLFGEEDKINKLTEKLSLYR